MHTCPPPPGRQADPTECEYSICEAYATWAIDCPEADGCDRLFACDAHLVAVLMLCPGRAILVQRLEAAA